MPGLQRPPSRTAKGWPYKRVSTRGYSGHILWWARAAHAACGERRHSDGVDDPSLLAQRWRVVDVLLKVDGEDIKRYAEREIAPYQSSSTPQDLQVRTFDYALLSGRAGSQFHVTVRNGKGKEEERVLTRLTLENRSKLKKDGASFKMRSDGIAVLTIDEFEDTEGTKALLANLPLINSAKGLVIDIRANGGGRPSAWRVARMDRRSSVRGSSRSCTPRRCTGCGLDQCTDLFGGGRFRCGIRCNAPGHHRGRDNSGKHRTTVVLPTARWR